jgi:hypothetical protein
MIPARSAISAEKEEAMDERELQKQKYQAQLDVWKADVDKLKARAALAKADARIEMNRHIKELERGVHEAGARLSELAEAGGDAWHSVRKEVDSTWRSLRAAVSAAASKFKE